VRGPTHHLSVADGFVYAPPPNEPSAPASGPLMAMFLPNMTNGNDLTAPASGQLPPGGIGAGMLAGQGAYWFNLTGGYFSCNREPRRPEDGNSRSCNIEAQAYRWAPASREEVLLATTVFELDESCYEPGDRGKCHLSWVDFSHPNLDFTFLSSVRFRAFYWEDEATDRVFVMDSLNMAWADDSCEAGVARGSGVKAQAGWA
ncbi:hypothetical protein B0J12DRAFT_562584, partial [Macrophomina phaseolina]